MPDAMARSAPARLCSRHPAVQLWAGLVCLAAFAPRPAPAVEVVFDTRFDDSGFFDEPARRELLELAAREYEAELRDALPAISFDALTAVIPHPSGNGLVVLEDMEVPADSLRVYVGARPLEGRLAIGAPGQVRFPCFELFPRQRCFDAMRGRGDLDEFRSLIFEFLFRSSPGARTYPAHDFAPWGGFLTFASDADWSFDVDRVSADRFDFLSVAIHEMGHVLGIGTAESWGAHTSGGAFRGDEVVRVYGGPAPLAADQSHWLAGTRARGDGRPPAFGPGLARGERRRLTDLDVAALRDIGWSTPAPGVAPGFADAYSGRRIKGDVDGDGRVDARDAALVRRGLEAGAAEGVVAPGAADVFPAVAEGPIGDGLVDEDDLRMLGAAVALAELARLGAPPRLGHIESELRLAGLPVGLASAMGLVRLLGWDGNTLGLPTAAPLRGDLDGDGVLTPSDVVRLERLLAAEVLADERAFDAADVAPAIEGEARGDGAVDEADAALLEAFVSREDPDGDGVPTGLENLLNELVWMPLVGRPRYEPLIPWTESCLDPAQLGPFGSSVAETGGPSLEFCGRNGTPWSLAPSISVEELTAGDPPLPSPAPALDSARSVANPTGGKPALTGGSGGPLPPSPPVAPAGVAEQPGRSDSIPPALEEARRRVRATAVAARAADPDPAPTRRPDSVRPRAAPARPDADAVQPRFRTEAARPRPGENGAPRRFEADGAQPRLDTGAAYALVRLVRGVCEALLRLWSWIAGWIS